MTVDDVKSMLARLEAAADDDETAHSMEDDIHKHVLIEVAHAAPEPWRSLAAEALKTTAIKFSRWCA